MRNSVHFTLSCRTVPGTEKIPWFCFWNPSKMGVRDYRILTGNGIRKRKPWDSRYLLIFPFPTREE